MQSIYYEDDIIYIEYNELSHLKNLQSKYGIDGPLEISADEKELHLKAGFVGVIATPKREIVILPRFKEFDFSVILKLWLVVRTGRQEINEEHISNYKSAKDNLYLNVVSQFIEEVRKLCNTGLSADYQEHIVKSAFLKGRLLIHQFLSQPIKNKFICKMDDFNFDNLRNGVIKYCIKKLILSTSESILKKKLIQLMPFFHDVQEKQDYNSIDFLEMKRSSNRLNQHYESVIGLCELIVSNMFLGGLGGKVRWFSFLINYDKLFEDFVRKALQIRLSKEFKKLPHNRIAYARYLLEEKGQEISKAYDPDIVYLYDERNNSSELIIDVKNKLSGVNYQSTPSWFENSDIFQVIAYAMMQKTHKCALVYPYTTRVKPIKLDITNDRISDFSIYAIFVDLSKQKIADSITELAEDIIQIT